MNHSFKFIVNPRINGYIEITSFLQYCALKHVLSNFDLNNIKSLINNKNPVLFSYDFLNDSDSKFTEYIKKNIDERNDFKINYFKSTSTCSLFFNVISEIEYTDSFEKQRPLTFGLYDLHDYTIGDLYTIFIRHEYAKKYLSKYIPKNSNEIEYVSIHKDKDNNVSIHYHDDVLNFYIIDSNYKDKEVLKEYTKLVNCININTCTHLVKNNGRIENTYDELCVYTEDPAIIYKVLMNNQVIIDKMNSNISYIYDRLKTNYLHVYDIFNELQTSIKNVVDAYETTKKEAEDNLVVLNDLFK